MLNFHKKEALITGCTEGIELAAVKLFAQSNAKVFIAARNAERGALALAELKTITPDAFFYAADMSKMNGIENMMAKCFAVFGRIDIAVNRRRECSAGTDCGCSASVS